MKEDNRLRVRFGDRLVGTMALTADKKVAFAYDDGWLQDGFPISPFSLPLKKQVFLPQKDYFQGLFGVFADSLPDAWGNLLLNRLLQRNGMDPGRVNILERLAIIGSAGMGALIYEPERRMEGDAAGIDLDELAGQCRRLLLSEYEEDLDKLYRLGGTSGGTRPKIMTAVDGEDWIIKFPAPWDGKDAGQMEYDYAACAKACGIEVPQTRLFPSTVCKGYFGSRRFDRRHEGTAVRRFHVLTAAALLELDFGQPSLDYHELMKLTRILTGGRREDMENMFRRMCFNVFAHNRDDHSKNFSFLYHEETDEWRLSPAYDLTYSTTYYGEHMTAVDGEGTSPGPAQLMAVGVKAGISRKRCQDMMEEVRDCVKKFLGNYLRDGEA